MNFLKENWLWIVAPIVLFAVAVAVVIVLNHSDPNDQNMYTLR